MNKKANILLTSGALICCLMFLAGCEKKQERPVYPEDLTEESSSSIAPAIAGTKTFSFTYTVSNDRTGKVIYTIDVSGSGAVAATYKPAGAESDDTVNKELTKDDLKELEDILDKHNCLSWNGFTTTTANRDKGSFSFYYANNDGNSISASGIGSFPEGYEETKAELIAFFSRYFK